MTRIYKTYGPTQNPQRAFAYRLLPTAMDSMINGSAHLVLGNVDSGAGRSLLKNRMNRKLHIQIMFRNVIQITFHDALRFFGLHRSSNSSEQFTNPAREFGVVMEKITNIRNSYKAVLIAMFLVSGVFAQGTPKLEINIAEEKLNRKPSEMIQGASVVYSPGDTLRYEITAKNSGTGLMTSPEIVDPIPAGVTYVAESAGGQNAIITYSINQGEAYVEWPPYYTVRNARGILVKRVATPEMVTHIKWNITKNIDPGSEHVLDFLVVVNN